MPYILWDWNGTLLDDTDACIDVLNIMLTRRKLPPVTREFFRDHFSFPARAFYELVGMHVEDAEWDALALEYHTLYSARPKTLNRETIAALERVKARGVGQSIISALRQDLLDVITRELGVAPYMDSIYGVDNLDGASKLDRALQLLEHIRDVDPIVIGDSLHDKEVADALGVKCVLCAQGSHAAWRLRAAAPTAETLLEAVDMALCL